MGKTAARAIAEIKGGAVYILQAGTPVFVKTADVCALTGKSNQWIGQLTNQGTLFKKKTPYGSLYELSSTVRNYIETLEDRNKTKETKDIEQQRKVAEVALKTAKAAIANLDLQERKGTMHRSEDVAAMTEDLIYAIRSAFLALPGRLAVDVVGAKNAAEASEIIRREVYSAMDELSSYQYDPAKYEARVRERLNMEALNGEDDDI